MEEDEVQDPASAVAVAAAVRAYLRKAPAREAPDLARRADRAAQRQAWDPIAGLAVSTTAHQQT